MKQNEKKLWDQAVYDMLYLIKCSLHSTVPSQERVTEMNLDKVYTLSRRQSLEAMTYMALERLLHQQNNIENLQCKDTLAKWKEAKDKIIRKTILMDTARNQLFAYLEKEKIWHVPLKGVILSQMYPKFGMRQMADNDVLFDVLYRQEVHDWFIAQGYIAESFNQSNHDVYQKQPVYNFEMHVSLFSEKANPKLYEYYASIKERLQIVPGKNYEYQMTSEDFYLYMLSHMHKHFSNNGTGIRSLLDLYVYLEAEKNLDNAYLKAELEKMELSDFDKEMRKLAQKVFASEFDFQCLSEKEKNNFTQLFWGSTYGTIENHWRNQVKKIQSDNQKISLITKIQYIWRRIMPPREIMIKWCEIYAPFILKHSWLMPLAYVKRIFKVGIKNRKLFMREVRTVKKM